MSEYALKPGRIKVSSTKLDNKFERLSIGLTPEDYGAISEACMREENGETLASIAESDAYRAYKIAKLALIDFMTSDSVNSVVRSRNPLSVSDQVSVQAALTAENIQSDVLPDEDCGAFDLDIYTETTEADAALGMQPGEKITLLETRVEPQNLAF